MTTKTLDEIVMEADVRERIRPLFEQATASGNVSFEHDFQWQAYCDLLYSVRSFEEDVKGKEGGQALCDLTYKRRKDLFKDASNSKAIDALLGEIVLDAVEICRRRINTLTIYGFDNRELLRNTLTEMGKRKYMGLDDDNDISFVHISYKDIKKRVEEIVSFINNTKSVICKGLKKSVPQIYGRIHNDNWNEDIIGEIQKLPELEEVEFEELDRFLLKASQRVLVPEYMNKTYAREREKRRYDDIKKVIMLLQRDEYKIKEQEGSRAKDAIECASISIPNITVLRKIGAGDFKETYLATHDVLEERVALKVLHPRDGTLKKSSVQRGLYQVADRQEYMGGDRKQRALARTFKEEAQALTKVSHRNIVRFLGAGLRPVEHIIEEYVEGRTLLDFALDPKERTNDRYIYNISWYLDQIYTALVFMHENFNILHLDIKPANIIIRKDHRAILTDFGCSHILNTDQDSPTYMSAKLYKPISRLMVYPETMKDGVVGRYADYWQWAVTAYMVLVGHHPFCPELTLGDCYSHSLSSERRDEGIRKIEENSMKWWSQIVPPSHTIDRILNYQTSTELIFATTRPKDFVERALAFNPGFDVKTFFEPLNRHHEYAITRQVIIELTRF